MPSPTVRSGKFLESEKAYSASKRSEIKSEHEERSEDKSEQWEESEWE